MDCPRPPWWSILLVGGALAVGGYVTGNRWVWIGAAAVPVVMLGANLICRADSSEGFRPLPGSKATFDVQARLMDRLGNKLVR